MLEKSCATTWTKTPIASPTRKTIRTWKRYLARRPMMSSAIRPMDLPFARMLMQSAEKSCTAPTSRVPTTTQIIAGTQPQITAMAGPSMGARPAMEA